MLKLKELRLSNIGRFVTPQKISFDTLGNLIQVDAENRNTKGSSGSGKSTIFNALEYLLGLNDIPTTVLQSRLTKDGISVSADFDWDGVPLTISRSKSSGLAIKIRDEVFTGSSKLAEEKLDQILAMPRKLFRPMLHKRQKEGGFFLNFTPSQTHEFLTDCLGLSGLRDKIDKLDKEIKALNETKTTTESSFQRAEAAYKATYEAMLGLGIAPVPEIHPEVVQKLDEKYKASLKVLREQEMAQKLELETLRATMPTANFADYDGKLLKSLQEKQAEVGREINRLNNEEKDRQRKAYQNLSAAQVEKSKLEHKVTLGKSAQNGAQKLALEIKKLREAICPTCDQSWITESAKTKENEMMSTLMLMKEDILAGKRSEEEVKALDNQIITYSMEQTPRIPEGLEAQKEIERKITGIIQEELQKSRDFNKTQQTAYDEKVKEYTQKYNELLVKQDKEIQQARGQAEVDRLAYDGANSKLESWKTKKFSYENQMASLNTQLKGYNTAVEENDQKLKQINKSLLHHEEAKRAIKSYASCSFEEALATISETSTRIIRAIPNMANATIQLEGIKETKEGKLKEEVNAVINMDGEIGIPIKSLSGGERSAVDLAVDLAVIDLIESKTGKGIDIFILDEPFTGLDTACIEMALEVLKSSNINKRLVIVDHNPEAKEMVHNRIVVVREGETSNITKVA